MDQQSGLGSASLRSGLGSPMQLQTSRAEWSKVASPFRLVVHTSSQLGTSVLLQAVSHPPRLDGALEHGGRGFLGHTSRSYKAT